MTSAQLDVVLYSLVVFLNNFIIYEASGYDFHLSHCRCATLSKGLAVICEGESVTQTELCSICETLSERVYSLEVRNTNLTNISDGCFKGCRKLEELSLVNTNLIGLENDSFAGLDSLSILKLDKNSLVHNCKLSNPFAFTNLFTVRKLFLRRNIDRARCDNGEQFLANLPANAFNTLQEIYLDGVKDVHFGRNFKNYKNLTHLSLSGFKSNCNINVLSNTTFDNVPMVTHLDLSNCNITNVDKGTFENLHDLINLNLSHNQGLGFPPLANVSYSLQSTNIKVLDYSKVYKTFGIGTALSICDMWYFKNTTLEELHIRSNRLTLIETNAFHRAPKNLKRLYAGDNEFTYGPFMLQTGCIKNLEMFELDGQVTLHNRQHYNEEINVNENYNVTIRQCSVPRLKDVDINCPYFTDKEELTYLNGTFPRNLTRLSASKSNMRRYTVRFNQTIPLRIKLEYLDVSSNAFYYLERSYMALPHLKMLNLSNNFCTYISNEFFDAGKNIEVLIINRNLLGSLLTQDTQGLIFKPLQQLKTLDLSDNKIVQLPKSVFIHNENVEFLNLAQNQLVEFNVEVEKMQNLNKIDLCSNQLRSVPIKLLDKIKKMSKSGKRNITIDLSNNIISFSCDNIDFLTWLSDNPEYFANLIEYSFKKDGSSEVLTYRVFLETFPKIQKNCISYAVLIVVATCAILLAIVISAAGILYRYRWRLKYLYYMARARHHNYDLLLDASSELKYPYDAFISFANEEFFFVKNELLPKLEDEFGLKLCVHARDFQPGTLINQNILEAIRKSRRTVVILSENFLKSKWCQYEFNMARMESIYSREGQSVLFVLIYQEVDAKQLSLEMLECMESETYAKYPSDESEKPYFWDCIKRALK